MAEHTQDFAVIFQVKRDVFKDTPGTTIHGEWLEYSSTDNDGNQSYVKTGEPKQLNLVNLLKDRSGSPFIIVSDYYDENAENVILSPEACHALDKLIELLNAQAAAAAEADISDNDEETESESDSEVEELPARRRRQITRGGVTFGSYEDMLHC